MLSTEALFSRAVQVCLCNWVKHIHAQGCICISCQLHGAEQLGMSCLQLRLDAFCGRLRGSFVA